MAKGRLQWLIGALLVVALLGGLARCWLRSDAPEPSVVESEPEAVEGPATPAIRLAPSVDATADAIIEGRVADAYGRAIAGAQVCASPVSGSLSAIEKRGTRCVVADGEGRYRIDRLWAVTWLVNASAPNFRPGRHRANVGDVGNVRLDPATTRSGIDIVLLEGGIEVLGTAYDISGGVIEGAEVKVMSGSEFSNDGPTSFATTGHDGTFSLWTSPGLQRVSIRADGYAGASLETSAPGPPVEAYLVPESVVRGRVFAADTRAPLAGVLVEVYSDTSFLGEGSTVYTDDAGEFAIGGLQPGIYASRAIAPGLYGEAARVSVGLMQISDPVAIEVSREPFVRGRLIVGSSGATCPYGWASLRGDDGELRGPREQRDGTLLIGPLRPGEYAVAVSCFEHVPEPTYPRVKIEAAGVHDVQWTVNPGATLAGRIVDDEGRPVAGARVSAEVWTPTPSKDVEFEISEPSDGDGRFEIRGLRPGRHTVEVADYERGRSGRRNRIVEVPERGRADVEVVVPKSGTLRGVVVDGRGLPVPRLEVRAVGNQGGGGRAFTDLGGAFRIDDVSIDGGKLLVFDRYGAPLEVIGGGARGAKRYTPSQFDDPQLRVAVETMTAAIAGRVVDEQGRPVQDAFVDVIRESERKGAYTSDGLRALAFVAARAPVLTDMSGRFTVGDLADGRYTIVALRRGGGFAVAEHMKTGEAVELAIADPATLAGTVRTRDGSTVGQFEIDLADVISGAYLSEDFFRADGAWSIAGLLPSRYRVTVVAPEGTAAIDVDAGPGEVRSDLELVLEPRIELRGRLVDLETDAPVAGYRVNVEPWRRLVVYGGPLSPDRAEISGADGYFVVRGAPRGLIQLVLFSQQLNVEPRYPAITSVVTLVRSDDAVVDLGDIPLARLRKPSRGTAADLGFTLVDDEPTDPAHHRLVVAEVRADGPAAAAGLRSGDEIVSVDGYPVRGLDDYNWAPLTEVEPRRKLAFGLADGRTVVVIAGPPS